MLQDCQLLDAEAAEYSKYLEAKAKDADQRQLDVSFRIETTQTCVYEAIILLLLSFRRKVQNGYKYMSKYVHTHLHTHAYT